MRGVGDSRENFDAFVVGTSPRLLRTAFLLVGDRNHAEDLLQEVLEKMYVGWMRIDDPLAYAHRALVRRAQNRWRSRLRKPETTWGDRDVAVDPVDVEGRDALVRALLTLPHGQRAVIVLRYLQDLTTEQTARALGCSVGTVKSQTARALPRLRALLDLAEESL
jgi:RNA polymerase sigma-70 factor (sigma-E family)